MANQERDCIALELDEIQSLSILTRTSGYLQSVASHSLQPYRGCALGSTLCGVGCYARHQRMVTGGRGWGSFLDVKSNAPELYLKTIQRERAWARRTLGLMTVFMSSSTEPFPPQERKLGVSGRILNAMLDQPPDVLIVQTHSPLVCDHLGSLIKLHQKCNLRVHLSIESDTDRLPGLPRPASSVNDRIEAAGKLKQAGLFVAITVAPLLPIQNPHKFFEMIATVADAVVIDHFIGGDGTVNGSRTRRTALPDAIRQVNPAALTLNYRDMIARIASQYFPNRVGVGIDGFAGRYDVGILSGAPESNSR